MKKLGFCLAFCSLFHGFNVLHCCASSESILDLYLIVDFLESTSKNWGD